MKKKGEKNLAHAEDPDAEEERPEGECVGFGYVEVIFQGQTQLGCGCGQLENAEGKSLIRRRKERGNGWSQGRCGALSGGAGPTTPYST